MPYISPKNREVLDDQINELSDHVIEMSRWSETGETDFAGILNYICTSLALQILEKKFGKVQYWTIAMISGVFNNVASEFYRRVATPYEEEKISINGDLEDLKSLSKE